MEFKVCCGSPPNLLSFVAYPFCKQELLTSEVWNTVVNETYYRSCQSNLILNKQQWYWVIYITSLRMRSIGYGLRCMGIIIISLTLVNSRAVSYFQDNLKKNMDTIKLLLNICWEVFCRFSKANYVIASVKYVGLDQVLTPTLPENVNKIWLNISGYDKNKTMSDDISITKYFMTRVAEVCNLRNLYASCLISEI